MLKVLNHYVTISFSSSVTTTERHQREVWHLYRESY